MKNNSFVRATALALVVSQTLMAVPVAAQSSGVRAKAAKAPLAPKVTVNRKVPTVTLPPAEPTFSAVPTVEEVFRARVFEEPIVPVGATPSAPETKALADALVAFHRSRGANWRTSLGRFLETHPSSPWQASLWANIGRLELTAHAYSSAFDAWDKSWELAKDATDPRSRAVADSALADWLSLASSVGPIKRIEDRLETISGRSFSGSAGMRIARAREAVGLVKAHPELVVQCGPEALLALLEARGDTRLPERLTKYRGTLEGVSLADLETLASQVGLNLRMAQRSDAGNVPVPAVVHLKVGHYVAVVEQRGDSYRLVDRSRNESYWLDAKALFAESSGFLLIARSASVPGWRDASNEDAAAIRGLGPYCPDGSAGPGGPGGNSSGGNSPNDGNGGNGGNGGDDPNSDEGGDDGGGGPDSCGMTTYSFQSSTASLQLFDTPVGYAPPRGPAVPFTLSYFHREVFMPQTFSFANLGPKWGLKWLRFVKEEPAVVGGVTQPAFVWANLPPGWREAYTGPDSQGVYPAHWYSHAVLALVSSPSVHYERRLIDGTVETYGLSDGAASGSRRFFLTSRTSPRGESLTFTWDSQFRLVAVTDTLGQVSTLHYDLSSDPLKVTSITDPFSRSATFTYNSAGQLASITDVLGLTSSFAYAGDDFVRTLTTPYGTTTFRHEPTDLGSAYSRRYIEATDPLGATEHLEFQFETTSLSATASSGEVPTGFSDWNTNLDHFNTFYWNKRVWALDPGNLANATVTHWLEAPEFTGWQIYSSPVAHSIKRPLEHRVWFKYPDQIGSTDTLHMIGSSRRAVATGRTLDDGASEISTATYNFMNKMLSWTDPLSRQTSTTYDTNGIDLLTVRQTTTGTSDLLATLSSYNSYHQPQSITDAAGQTTDVTYNTHGQVLTVTNALDETTTYAYNTSGYLTTITGAVSGAVTTFTYDGYGRVRTVTGPDSYSLTIDYDAFDRPTRVTYPDSSYQETTYDRLDVSSVRDRLGRTTRYYYDAMRRLVATRDAAGRIVAQSYCPCGALESVTDPNGNKTSWTYDMQGRVTAETRADSSVTSYVYETTTSRLHQRTDPKGQHTNYSYAIDGNVTGISYTSATTSTPSVSYSYSSVYPRVTSVTDGIGTTAFTYVAPGTLGAGGVAAVDGPLTNDTITYTYDELGRQASRALNSVTATWAFDALGRVTTLGDPIGDFTFAYDGVTARLQTLTYPNGQTSTYAYASNSGDRRLQSITHQTSASATLSAFTYAYDTVGNITTWTQQYQSTTRAYDFGYDAVDQLTSATYRTTGGSPTILNRYGYTYDAVGNRTGAELDDVPVGSTFNSVNRLVSQSATAPLRFEGTVNEASTVRIQGKPVPVDGAGRFVGTAAVTSGTNTINVSATDASGNTTSQDYEVSVPSASGSFTYDANGNLTAHGTKTYEWDAENRLVTVSDSGTPIASFTYDGAGRRATKTAGGVTHSYIYDGDDIIQDRTSITTLRHIHGPGIDNPLATVDGSTPSYYLADHLGSIVQVTNASQSVTLTRQYDPYGNPLDGGATSGYGFTGREWDAETGLYYYRARYYDPALGRFISSDPIGLDAGPNTFAYVNNGPTGFRDPSGNDALAAVWSWGSHIGEAISNAGASVGTAVAAVGTAVVAVVTSPVTAVVGTITGGVLIGRGIGHLPIGGGRTVDDAVADGFSTIWAALDSASFSKGGKQNKRDTGLRDLSDEEIRGGAKDKSLSPQDRKRFQTEEKARGLRNKQKRCQ